MMVGYTPGGSPIFHNVPGKTRANKSRVLYECSNDPRHKLTKNQARSNGYNCSHCQHPLKVKPQKIQELKDMARSLGATIVWKEK